MTISHRELFVDDKHDGGDGSKEKKPLLTYVAQQRLKIMKIEEEEEEEEKVALVPEYPFPHHDRETLMNPWNQRCLAPKSESNFIN